MTLYRKYIRPMHSYPGPDYSQRVMPIETEVKWYPEEERECLKKKYEYYNEGSFSDLVFEEKYELCLLKEQEAVDPQIAPFPDASRSDGSWFYICGACSKAIDPNDKYCRWCGRSVKWE